MALVNSPFDEGVLAAGQGQGYGGTISAAGEPPGASLTYIDQLTRSFWKTTLPGPAMFREAERLHVGHGDRQFDLCPAAIAEQISSPRRSSASGLDRRSENPGGQGSWTGEPVDELARIESTLRAVPGRVPRRAHRVSTALAQMR